MKKLILLFLTAGFCNLLHAEKGKNPLMASDTVVWAGLDYSMARMISDDPTYQYNFKAPDFILAGGFEHTTNITVKTGSMPYVTTPSILEQWNKLFVDESINQVANVLEKKVSVDIIGVTERNKTTTTNQIVQTPDPNNDGIGQTHITKEDIANEVRSYKMENTNGLGLVFIIDRLINIHFETAGKQEVHKHISSYGAVYVVFFDVATREIISEKREINSIATSSSFRNFWFGPIKDTVSSLDK